MNIMLVEDDLALCNGIHLALSNDQDYFFPCHSLAEARDCRRKNHIEMVILDVNLPDGSGYELLKEIRQEEEIPVLILTANDLEMDEVTGLSLGADDYVTKPFRLAVLRARIEVLKRRSAKRNPEIFQLDDFQFDFEKLMFQKGEEELFLSRNEQKLLRLFLENQGRILTREQLIQRLWTDGADFVDENALSVTVNRLRRKLEDGKKPRYIQTIYGQGYLWRKEV